jgi:hypothetical protein
MIGFHRKSTLRDFEVACAVEGIGAATRLSIDADIHCIFPSIFPMNVMGNFLRKKMEEGVKKQLELEVQDLSKLCGGA